MTTYLSPPVSCIYCRKEKSAKGIFSHFLANHSSNEDKEKMSIGRNKSLENFKSKGNEYNAALHEHREIEYSANPNKCKQCNSIISIDNRGGQFCSRSCSARYNNHKRKPRTATSKATTSISMNKYFETHPQTRAKIQRICPIHFGYCIICNTPFSSISKRITCSDPCKLLASTKRRNNYYYKGIRMDSSWEVEFAKYLDVNHIEWTRPNNGITYTTDKTHKYYPDFYLPKFNVYFDPKNDYRIKTTRPELDAISKIITLHYGNVPYLKIVLQRYLELN